MSARITGTLHPWGPISQADRVRSYQSGRVCTHADCGTILSIYNPSRFACEQCGTVFETGNQARKFCSDRCRMAAFARRKRARLRAESRLLKAQSLHQAVAPAPDGREPVGSAA
jgi:predicted nucleic acid-binding Zn ribbon protein